MNQLKSQEQFADFCSDSDSRHFNNKDIYLQSESEKQKSISQQSDRLTSKKQQHKPSSSLELLESRLAAPVKIEKPIKESLQGRKRGRKSKAELAEREHHRLLQMQSEIEKQFKSMNKEEKKQQKNEVYGHFKVALDYSFAQCVHCKETFSFDKSICIKSNVHISSCHPQKFDAHIFNKQIEQIEPKLDDRGFVYPKYEIPKNRKSCVWEHFMFNQQFKFAVCRICKMAFSVKDGSTSGMLKHISRDFPAYERLSQQLKQQQIQQKQSKIAKQQKQAKQAEQQEQNNLELGIRKKRKYSKRKPKKAKITQNEILEAQKKEKELQKAINKKIKTRPEWIDIMYYQHPSTSRSQLLKIILNRGLASRSQAKKVIRKYHWSCQQIYEDIFTNLSLHQDIFLEQSDINCFVANVRIYSTQMEQAYQLFGDCLSIWIVNSQMKDQNIKQFVYFTVQDRQGRPFVVGLVVCFNHDSISYRMMLDKFFDNVHEPQCVSISGQRSNVDILKKQMEKIVHQKDMKTKIIVFEYPSCIQTWDYMSEMVKQRQQNNFVGFLFTKKHMKTIRLILKSSDLAKKSIKRYLVQFFRKNAFLHSFLDSLNEHGMQPKQRGREINQLYLSYFHDQHIVNLHTMLPREVFQKFLVSYIFGRFYTKVISHIHTNTTLSYTLSSSLSPHNTTSSTVTFNPKTNHWQCSCNLLINIGLPCPHLMYILSIYDGLPSYYINSRWLLNEKYRQEKDHYYCMRDICEAQVFRKLIEVQKMGVDEQIKLEFSDMFFG